MWIPFVGEYIALHLLLEFLEDKKHFVEGTCNIPNFSHHSWNIRVLDFINKLSKENGGGTHKPQR